MLMPFLLLTLPGGPSLTVPTQRDPPIHVWLNQDGRYMYGDQARVYVRTAGDGYLLVLRSDARGNIRVLSPLDPDDDQEIHAHQKYQVKGRGDREAFVVEDTLGQGVVLAAWSKTPFDLRRFERNGHWDLRGITQAAPGDSSGDQEARLLSVVDQMNAEGNHYEYDIETYVVYAPRFAGRRFINPYPYPYGWSHAWYDPWWDGPYFGARLVIVPRPFGFRR